MNVNGVEFPLDAIRVLCENHGIARLSLFGSILRPASNEDGSGFRPSSDIDLLVEFLPGRTPGLIAISGVQLELQALLGRAVDLRTPKELSRFFRDDVQRMAVPLHAA